MCLASPVSSKNKKGTLPQWGDNAPRDLALESVPFRLSLSCHLFFFLPRLRVVASTVSTTTP